MNWWKVGQWCLGVVLVGVVERVIGVPVFFLALVLIGVVNRSVRVQVMTLLLASWLWSIFFVLPLGLALALLTIATWFMEQARRLGTSQTRWLLAVGFLSAFYLLLKRVSLGDPLWWYEGGAVLLLVIVSNWRPQQPSWRGSVWLKQLENQI